MSSIANEIQTDITVGVDRLAYPFQSHWIKLTPALMHYLDEGEGEETLLFVHGTPSWSFEWRHIISALSPSYRSIAVDLIGFGLSERPAEFAYTPEAHSEAINEFAEELDLRNITLVVHDFGGPIGLPLALRATERIKRLVILNTWMWSLKGDKSIKNISRIVSGQLGRLLYRWANISLRLLMPSAYGDRPKLKKEVHNQYLERFSDPQSRELVLWPLAKSLLGSSEFYESLWRDRTALQKLPALVIWGMKDSAFGRRYLERWKEVLPQAQIMEVPDAGHWPQEEEPDKVIGALRTFLKD